MAQMRVAVTGAGGKTGRAVVRALADAGMDVTAWVRRDAQCHQAKADGATCARVVDLCDAATVEDALAGQDGIYFIAPNMHPGEVDMTAATVRAAERSDVPHFMLHSVLAPYAPAMPHHVRKAECENLLRESSLEWTVLQPASYAQNVLPYLQTARSTGLLTVPYSPAAPFTPVDLADVAAAAATTMADTRHRFATYELCGPELLDTETMAARLAEVLDRPVEAAEQPLEEWQAAADLPEHVRDGLVAMFAYYDRHGLTGSSWTLEQLLGRRPTSFTAAVLRDLPASGG